MIIVVCFDELAVDVVKIQSSLMTDVVIICDAFSVLMHTFFCDACSDLFRLYANPILIILICCVNSNFLTGITVPVRSVPR